MKTYRASLALAALLAAAPAPAQDLLTNRALVPVSGVVSGSPESVAFSGSATVSSRLAKDPDFNSPALVLTIDLSSVNGLGSTTGMKYVIAGPEFVHRRVAATHAIEITFPFTADGSALRTGVAFFTLDFDTATGAVTRGTGNVSSPNFSR